MAGPDGWQDVDVAVGRVERDPVLPCVREEVHVARRMDAADQRQVGRAGLAQATDGAALQLMQHMIEPRRRFMERHQPAAEHFMPTNVQAMVRVVKNQHHVNGHSIKTVFSKVMKELKNR